MGIARELAELGSAYNSGGINQFRNRIINGQMQIDQRNAGASRTISATQEYFTDRFSFNCTGSITGQQVVDAPTGFTYSLKGTVNASTLRTTIFQRIEANNLSDSIAGANTLSFWAKSSQTGIRSANYTLTNSSGTDIVTYIAEFNITVANTWQQFSISVPSPSTLTGVNTYGNGMCAQLSFIFSKDGSPSVGTVGAWNSSTPNKYGVSTNLIAMTSGETFNITGVQLEKGSTATSFDYRPYGTELGLAQRYYQKSYSAATAVASTTFVGMEWMSLGVSGRIANTSHLIQSMRDAPSIVPYDQAGAANRVRTSAGNGQTGYNIQTVSTEKFVVDYNASITELLYHWTASAEL
jgi:hypothetical protein